MKRHLNLFSVRMFHAPATKDGHLRSPAKGLRNRQETHLQGPPGANDPPQVVREGPPVEAALEQPRVPAPQPSRAQRQAARTSRKTGDLDYAWRVKVSMRLSDQ